MANYRLLDQNWRGLVAATRAFSNVRQKARVQPADVFRIARINYDGDRSVVCLYLEGYLTEDPSRLFQCYMESRCDLYSYKQCYKLHAGATCAYRCQPYKTFVMPGVRKVHSEKINVVKYKRSPKTVGGDDKYCLDSFLKNANRVHMQTDLKEGVYIQFVRPLDCCNHRIQCDVEASYKDLIKIVPSEELRREIQPVVACYDIETTTNLVSIPTPERNRIISIAMAVSRDDVTMRVCLYYLPGGPPEDIDQFLPSDATTDGGGGGDIVHTLRFNDELVLLHAFFQLLPMINPDFVLDYNGDKFDLPFILGRIKVLRRKGNPKILVRRYDLDPAEIGTAVLHDKFAHKMNTHFFTHYSHLDVYMYLTTDQEYNNLENYSLNTVAEHYLQETKVDLKLADMMRLYESRRLADIIRYNLHDCVLPMRLFQKLEIANFLYVQCMLMYLCTDDALSNISHKVTTVLFKEALDNERTDERTGRTVPDPYFFNKRDLNVTSGRKRRFDETEPVVDDQMVDLSLLKRTPIGRADIPVDSVRLCSVREKCVYKGGKVLEPRPGLKRWVVTVDFNSLYLTIMMCEGVCLSNLFVADDGNVYLHRYTSAVLPKTLRKLLDLRGVYKTRRDAHQPHEFQYQLNDMIQNAVKRIPNSMYGYMGIFVKPLANFITKIGRTRLKESIKRIEAMSDDADILKKFQLSKCRFRVVYGDTDSAFIQVDFVENEIDHDKRYQVIQSIVNEHVLRKLNDSWQGYRMSLENIMCPVILLKKKKYCYLNSEKRIKYKGWLVKKDMPLFLRKTFRAVVDSFLHGHSVVCGLKLLAQMLIESYNAVINNVANLDNYRFSMTYRENTSNKKRKKPTTTTTTPRPKVITIAKHCYEILASSGAQTLAGNGDRISYVLIDVPGTVTQQAYPLELYDASVHALNWTKHMGIVRTFLNELIQVFGDRDEFQTCFDAICDAYMSGQKHSVKFPVLKPISKAVAAKACPTNSDDESDHDDDDDAADDDEEDDKLEQDNMGGCLNYARQFVLYVKRPSAQSYDSAAVRRFVERVPVADCDICVGN
jgi:DNA polymerase elongation subunit (family B)